MKLVICEKRTAANRIAWILSGGKFKTYKFGKIPYYSFERDGENWVVVGLKGHIISLDFPKELNRWNSVPLEELIWAEPVKFVSEKSIEKLLEKFAKENPEIIIATDYDREGELIGVETIELLKKRNKNLEKVKRARFSALTKEEIEKAFSNLVDIDYNLARSAEARQFIDLIWGATLTRFISISANKHGKNFLSIGRVQSPTLAMIVDREKEIRDFIPKPYWQIVITFKKEGEKFQAVYSGGNIFEEEVARKLYEEIKDEKVGVVENYTENEKREPPPPPFDTTSFLATASSMLRIPAAKAMEIAENLYMNGWISYPRTDNTVYPKSLSIGKLLKVLSHLYPKEVDFVRKNMRRFPTSGKKESTDHPPIHPVDCPPVGKLGKEHRMIYDLVARRFFATLTKDAVVMCKKGSIRVGGLEFVCEGKENIEKNWKEIYPVKERWKKLPKLEIGEELEIVSVNLVRKETRPPKRFTQGSLISEMERHGLGTKSTRHDIIRKLYSRKYVVGYNLIPTESAFAVIETIKPYEISKPDMTAQLERDMDEIAEGKKEWNEVVKKSRELLQGVLKSLRENEKTIRENLRAAIKSQNVIGKCPKCGKDMVIRVSSNGKRFVGCTGFPDCRVTYPLPQKGYIEKTGKSCEHCGAPIIKIKGKEICINPECNGKF